MLLRSDRRVWVCVRDGYVYKNSIAPTKKKSIEMFVDEDDERFRKTWGWYKMNGWQCIRINIIYEVDESYNKYKKKQK